jgi:hypothetical protein
MYNRYIPQPDGSFRRSRIEDSQPKAPPSPPPQPPPCEVRSEPQPLPPRQETTPKSRRSGQRPYRAYKPPKQEDTSVTGFLRRLLPKDFDTGDLIVVLLLLLMAGDCTEDQNTALLTLALYFFM